MKTRLIADAGSTKVEWAFIDSDGNIARRFQTDGINALMADSDAISGSFVSVSESLASPCRPEEIYYYGAGCATPEICGKIKDAARQVWSEAEISVSSDLLGAARSLFGGKKGIACILGTGSNSCLYDGKEITSQIPSLGFILGDEGSGAALGKRLINDVFKLQLPEDIREKFLGEYRLSLPEILEKTYSRPYPNRFLASFVPFIKDNLWNPDIYSIVLAELTEFIRKNVAMYHRAHTLELCFTGSVAASFDKVLREAAASQGYRISAITKSPMDGLIKYHTETN